MTISTLPLELQAYFDKIRALTTQTLGWPSTKKIKTNVTAIQANVDAIAADLTVRLQTKPPLPSPSGVTVLSPGDDLQRACDEALPGDTLQLQAGVTYTVGTLRLGHKDGPVTLCTTATLPNRRIGPADAPLLPFLTSGGQMPTIDGTGAANWILKGLNFTSRPLGEGEIILWQNAEYIWMESLLIVAGVDGQKRAIRGNGRNIVLVGSHIANIIREGQDSQAFAAWDGAGPYLLRDDYFSASGENVLFGGADSASPEGMPADVTIDNCDLEKPGEWRQRPGTVKNLLEFKAGRRVRVTNSTFRGSWTDAQNGYAILFKSVNQDHTAPWSETVDVVFENNDIDDCENGFNIQGQDPANLGGRTSGIVIRNCSTRVSGVGLQLGGGAGEVTLDRTTFDNGGPFLQLYEPACALLRVRNVKANISADGYGAKGAGMADGLASLTAFATVLDWADVLLQGTPRDGAGSYPDRTWFAAADVPAGTVVGR